MLTFPARDICTLIRHSAFLLLLCLLPACVLTAFADVTLADHGKSGYRIVVAADAIPSEHYAAEELQHYLEKISGAKIPIITDAKSASSREILIGDNAHLRRLKPGVDFSKLGEEGFILRTSGKRLIIAGGKPRGTLYGVYTLLEDKLGVRWFTPELEVVPKAARLALPTLDETHLPALEYREVYWREMLRDADFAARHRLNGQHYDLSEKHGGRAEVYYPFVHTLDKLIPPSLFTEHPEYFPLRDGKRIHGYVQRCLSNPDVVKLAIQTVRHWLQKHPEATIVSVSQNDTANWCQCPSCKALDDAEGSPSASLIRFVNAIAADIETDYPRVRIDTLAYQYTRKPPKTLRPRKNVIIRLCSIECCFSHPFETCSSQANARFRADLEAWQPVAPTLFVWDYSPNFANYQQPFPNFGVLQPNVQFLVRHGVTGVFQEGNYSSGGNGELAPLRSYLLAELLWNPDLDVAKATSEFLNAYYGKAAPQIQAYLNLLEGEVRDPQRHAHLYDHPTAAYLNEDFLTAADKLFAEGEAAADNDDVRLRVETARLPIWYVQLAAKRVQGQARSELLTRFLSTARKSGISNISEGQTLDSWAAKMQAR